MSTELAGPPEAPPEALGLKLNFFKLVVRDLDAARAFYTRAFGFEQRGPDVVMPGLREAMLARPGDRFTLVLYHHTDGRAVEMGGAYGPVGFLTRDLEGAIGHVLACGGTAGRGPFDLPGMRIAFAFDPDGHELELIQMTGAPAAAPPQE